MLEQLDPVPACIQNSRYDVLAYSRTYARLLCDLDAVPPEDRNCLLLAFTHDDWRASVVDLSEVARTPAGAAAPDRPRGQVTVFAGDFGVAER